MGIPHVLTQQVDSTTWQALGLVLTVVGLLVSAVVWRSRGAGHGLRAVAWSLVPLAAGLTGLLRLAWEVLDSLLRWATGLVFSPVVWLGVGVLVLALALHVAGSLLARRDHRTTGGGSGVASVGRGQRTREQPLDDQQDDIEAILRKHGIS